MKGQRVKFKTLVQLSSLFLLACLVLAGCQAARPGAKLVGQPIDIKFTAVDGREVDLASMQGEVVLVDFWASWCPPCLREVPHVKEAYQKLHGRGFEVVGISVDDEKKDLLEILAKEKIEWPQYFDPKGFEHKLATKFGIEQIPVMWLVDKSGRLREIDATENLMEKVEKLLAENQ